MRWGTWLAVALLALAPPLTPVLAAERAVAQATPTDPAWQAAARLHRGVNVLGYDPLWTDPAKARFQPKHFAIIRKGGFDFVRVVLHSFAHMDRDNRLDRQWLATLDRVFRQATAAGLSVIIDEHDFDYCADNVAPCETKLIAFWQQIGAHYADAPANVYFELLNEPHNALNGAPWNALLAKVIPVIRATNPRRTLIIGPSHWNSLADLPLLQLPASDRNIIVTIHYYEPFRFTHQGARWAGDVAKLHDIPLTADDERRIVGDFDTAAAWSKANDRPLLLGEFGAYDKSGTPIADRARYTRDVRQAAESHGMPWAYWQFDGDFVLYDIGRDSWVEPIRQALVGTP